MKALLLYESFFGNTRDVAEAIGKGIASIMEVDIAEVSGDHADLEQYDLLVVGGPTHVLGMSRNRSRLDARQKATEQGVEPVSQEVGIREMLDSLERSEHRPLVATFDTSIKKRFLPLGSAAKAAMKRHKKKGFDAVMDAEQFKVSGTEGPMNPGEIERAEEWGRKLATAVQEKVGPVEVLTA